MLIKKSVKSGYSVERGLISKLIETKDMKTMKDQQIKVSFFTGDNKNVYRFINEQFVNTGEIPTERVIKHKFPNYTIEHYVVDGEEKVGTEESLNYWCNELHQKVVHNRTADLVESVAKELDSGKSIDAFSLVKKGVWDIEEDAVVQTSVDITQNADERKEAYLKRKENHGMMGIPTGIEQLDFLMKGLPPETLTVLIALSGQGKTWFLVLLACYAMLNNYRAVVFLTEMSQNIMEDRFDAMLYGMIYGEFNYEAFKSGRLSPEQEKKYFEFLEEKKRLEPLIIETATGVSSVVGVIQKEKPDIVFIDGVYLMEDDRGAKDDWLRVAHITRDLKKVSKTWHLPVFVNTQADKNTSKKTGPELGSIMYTQAIGQDADNVLALYRDEVMISDHEMGVKILKQREGTLGKVVMTWDFRTMDFSGIYTESSSNTSEEFDEKDTSDKIIDMDDETNKESEV